MQDGGRLSLSSLDTTESLGTFVIKPQIIAKIAKKTPTSLQISVSDVLGNVSKTAEINLPCMACTQSKNIS